MGFSWGRFDTRTIVLIPIAIAINIVLGQTVAATLDRALVDTDALYVDVETRGEITAGMTVADRRGLTGRPANLDVARSADVATFLDRLIELVGGLAADRVNVAR